MKTRKTRKRPPSAIVPFKSKVQRDMVRKAARQREQSLAVFMRKACLAEAERVLQGSLFAGVEGGDRIA